MSVFYLTITRAINDYKALLRRNLPAKICSDKLKNLGIKRKQLRLANELELFHIAQKIITDLENAPVKDKKQYSASYCGSHQFLQHLKNIVLEYTIEEQTIIHIGQMAARALVAGLQLIATHGHELAENNYIAKKLIEYSHIIIKHGNMKQIKILTTAITQHRAQHSHYSAKIPQEIENLLAETPNFS